MKINHKKIRMQTALLRESARTDIGNGLDDTTNLCDTFGFDTFKKDDYPLNKEDEIPTEYFTSEGMK